MAKTNQKRCKRGHLLEHNRFIVKTKYKKTGRESGCRLCKNMRNKLQALRTKLKESGNEDEIPTLEDFSKWYFENY